jgi:uncharacterized protein (DUF1330 family)
MAAYLVADYVEISDPAVMEEYRQQIVPTLAPYGGRFIVRGGKTVPLEGGWEPLRLVIIEFPSLERAQAWYASDEYRGPLELRKPAARIRLIFVEGV